jgi:hypothetical protein
MTARAAQAHARHRSRYDFPCVVIEGSPYENPVRHLTPRKLVRIWMRPKSLAQRLELVEGEMDIRLVQRFWLACSVALSADDGISLAQITLR